MPTPAWKKSENLSWTAVREGGTQSFRMLAARAARSPPERASHPREPHAKANVQWPVPAAGLPFTAGERCRSLTGAPRRPTSLRLQPQLLHQRRDALLFGRDVLAEL